MITEIPTEDDFLEAGLGYLTLAWQDAIDLSLQAEQWQREYEECHAPDEHNFVEAHWQRARRRLATCALLVHQGTEFLLKASITQVSPYLLLRTDDGWSGRTASNHTPFSHFRTVDAQYLPNLYDSVCAKRLAPNFRARFEQTRQRRNVLMHSHAREVTPTALDVLRDVVASVSELIEPGVWPRLRREYVGGDPNAVRSAIKVIHFRAEEVIQC